MQVNTETPASASASSQSSPELDSLDAPSAALMVGSLFASAEQPVWLVAWAGGLEDRTGAG